MKKSLYVLIILVVALGVRLYPTVTTGMPFSTDAWPLMRNTEVLLQNTPVSLNSGVFDGYNNFWPLSSIFGAVVSLIAAVPATTAMAIAVPIAAALTIPVFYMPS